MINRMLDTCKTTEPLLKSAHRDLSVSMSSTAALLLCTALERDVAHIVPQDEEAVGKMFGMFSPGSVPCFPATQHATTAETLHPVTLPKVVEASFGQILGSNRCSGWPRGEGLKPGLLSPHVRNHRVGGLINHLSCSQTILQVLCFFTVDGAISQWGIRTWVKAGAVSTAEKFARWGNL